MKHIKVLFLLLLLLPVMPAFAQQKAKFHIASFRENPLDLTPKTHEKLDADGRPYAIIKVTSSSPDDDLSAYHFNFEHIPHVVEVKDGELWVYVGRNAMYVNISRDGYHSINHYELNTTIQQGRAYEMKLSVEPMKVLKQMLRFNVSPADAKAVVMYYNVNDDSEEGVFGYADANGSVAKLLPLGTYVYKVKSEYWHTSEGRIVLDGSKKVHEESVTLRPNSAYIELKSAAETDIYLDGVLLGRGSWSGKLKKGSYSVECRRVAHKSSHEAIIVEDGKDMVVELKSPTPITGSLSVNSNPLDAQITVDGKSYGETPNVIDNLIIGAHDVVVSKSGYKSSNHKVDIKEGEFYELDVLLEEKPKEGAIQVMSDPPGANIEIGGKSYGYSPAILEGIPVGRYNIKLSKKGYKSNTSEVVVSGNDTERVFVALSPIKGSLNITSSPSYAEIELNGKSYGKTPRTIENLPLGKYKVEVSSKGYRSQTREFNIIDDKEVKADFSLAYRGNRFKRFFRNIPDWGIWDWFNLGLTASAEYGFVTIDECEVGILGAGAGALIRIGNTETIFNLVGGAKYWYTSYNDTNIQQVVYPIVLNWNIRRGDDVAAYIGVGYEFGQILEYEYQERFTCDDGGDHENVLMAPATDVIFQVGTCGRHFDWNLYMKASTEFDYFTFGTGLTFFL